MAAPSRAGGFGAFFKRYTKTWQHAVATAALTAFGTLTFVDRWFAVLAILAYLVPPLVLYLRESSSSESPTTGDDSRDARTDERRGIENDHGEESEPADGPASEPADQPTGEPADGRPEETEDPDPTWTTATVPSGETLLDVAVVGNDAYAVGSEGTVLGHAGGEWAVAVPDGPGAQSNALRGVAAVAGGGVWFAGDSGAVGRLDPSTGRHVDHSAPDDDTTNVADVAAAGASDGETVLLVDGSGRVRRGRYRDGEVTWGEPVKPGSGSSLAGVTLVDESSGYACDTDQCVFETEDGGRSFGQVGLDAAEGTLTDVAATGPGSCSVSDDDGVVHRYDGGPWTPERLGDGTLWALALHGERGLASGDDGTVYERAPNDPGWERTRTPATVPLRGVAIGPSRAVAVGADGTVVERTVGTGGS